MSSLAIWTTDYFEILPNNVLDDIENQATFNDIAIISWRHGEPEKKFPKLPSTVNWEQKHK